jgi:hypothetical protein
VIGQSTAYRSAFVRWDERASVRSKPRRVLESQSGLYFPPELIPFLDHPLVLALDAQARYRLLVHRLYQYLQFTVELEQAAVVPVASGIARAHYHPLVPESMRADAFAIATDEAYHAQVANDLTLQVHRATGVDVVVPAEPQFLRRFNAINASVDRDVRPLLHVVFACITETLITATLAQLPGDQRLPRAVRQVVTDHADDERIHHAYFRQVLARLWPALDARHVEVLGPRLPDLILAYLDPDRPALAASLAAVGLERDAIETVLDETIGTSRTRPAARRAASSTIRYLAEVGALEHSATRTAFEAAELIGDDVAGVGAP